MNWGQKINEKNQANSVGKCVCVCVFVSGPFYEVQNHMKNYGSPDCSELEKGMFFMGETS